MILNLMFILLIIICFLLNYYNCEDWCINGNPTATTEECICSSHLGYFCRDSGNISIISINAIIN